MREKRKEAVRVVGQRKERRQIIDFAQILEIFITIFAISFLQKRIP